MRALKVLLALMLLASTMPAFSHIGVVSAEHEGEGICEVIIDNNDQRLFDTDGDGLDDTIFFDYYLDIQEDESTACSYSMYVDVTINIFLNDTYIDERSIEHHVVSRANERHVVFLTAPADGEYDFLLSTDDDSIEILDQQGYVPTQGSSTPNIVEIDPYWVFTPYDKVLTMMDFGAAVDNQTMYVLTGQSVVWAVNAGYPHTATSDDGSTFDSGGMTSGDTYSYTFNSPGTYNYSCTFHPGQMQGVIVVMDPITFRPFETNQGIYSAGDYIHYDGQMLADGLGQAIVDDSDEDFDTYQVSRAETFEITFQGGPVDWQDATLTSCPMVTAPTSGGCNLLLFEWEADITFTNSTDNRYWKMELGLNVEMYFSYPFDGKKFEIQQFHHRLTLGNPSSGDQVKFDDWENSTGDIEQSSTENSSSGGMPTEFTVGDEWTFNITREMHFTEKSCEYYAPLWTASCDGDEYWENDTDEMTQSALAQRTFTLDAHNHANQSDSSPTMFNAVRLSDWGEGNVWINEQGMPLNLPLEFVPLSFIPLAGYSMSKIVDSDGDGVPDSSDSCPGTALGATVDATGCSTDQLDDDGDGVPNIADDCADTDSQGMTDIDANGCAWEQRDEDGDGILNYLDFCQGTPAGETVDTDGMTRGCSTTQKDTDGDGVSDANDTCPGFNDAIDVDGDGIADGCDSLIDSDGDLVADEDDLCEGHDDSIDVDDDGIPDGCDPLIDSDRDDVADADDQCPGYDDAIDVDGDGIIDGCDDIIDSDGDGVADSFEMCPGYDDAIDVDADGTPDGCDSIIDADFDFVANGDDECPDTVATEVVNENGCSPAQLDTDSDGVNDAEDHCPVTPGGTHDADADGCPDDTDGDGILDVDDACAGSSADEQVDTTGCVPDTGFFAGGFGGEKSILLGGLAALLVSIILLVTVMIVRRGRESEDYKQQSELFKEVSTSALKWSGAGMPSRGPSEGASMPTSGAPAEPSSPHVAQVGEVHADSYEYLEHPPNSDNWWYRDQQTNHWQRWVK